MLQLTKHPIASAIIVALACVVVAGPLLGVEYKKKSASNSSPPLTTKDALRVLTVSRSLGLVYSDSGRLSLSVDAMGTNLGFGTVEVEKPEYGTVTKAFLVAAATGYVGHTIQDGEITINGHRIVWDQSIHNTIGSDNAVADVTRFVKTKIDAAPPGRVIIDIAEDHSDLIDGIILAVVFDDPNQSPDNAVALYFGAHSTAGDSLVIDLPNPVPENPMDVKYLFSIGISFGLQTEGSKDQYSVIEVNGKRLTTSAGGPDDGSPKPGALITVGGLGDSPSNPEDAYALPRNLLSDDEYYDLAPFLTPGDSQIRVKTSSAARDENIFFAGFYSTRSKTTPLAQAPTGPALAGAGAVALAAGVGFDEIALNAESSETRVGDTSEIRAMVYDGGEPVAGIDVQLQIISGPHAGVVSEAKTDATGAATFLYRGQNTGRDLLIAVIGDESGAVAGSNVLIHSWIETASGAYIDVSPGVCPSTVELGLQDLITVALVGTEEFDVEDVDITSLYLGNAAPTRVQYRDVSRPGPGGDCSCSDEGGDGLEDMLLQFKIQDLLPDPAGVADGETRRVTLTGAFKTGASFEATNCVEFVKATAGPTQLPEEILVPVTTETVDSEQRQ
ncbi:MAG: hypothetical protein JSW50_14880 [Candidatus Latescibacterota bacterium]|nr:MAG: hypothetical protein JSW50_14880 [Candidatus Latescibacterota bacterium]